MAALLPWRQKMRTVLCQAPVGSIRLPPSVPHQRVVDSYEVLVGVDEVGRGSLAGPVVAASLVMTPDFDIATLNNGVVDSKRLNPKQREQVYQQLTQSAGLKWSVAYMAEKHIDEVNILQATLNAMTEAVQKLKLDPHAQVLVDGNKIPPKLNALFNCKSVVGGDSRQFVIAAASIIAKVERDRYMCMLDKDDPRYGFANHKGYATKKTLLGAEAVWLQQGPQKDIRTN